MENFFGRYRNPSVLGLVLLVQLIGLAAQIKRPADPRRPDAGSVRLIRLWAMALITPIEKVLVGTGDGLRDTWHDYVNMGGLRTENRALREQVQQLKIEQARYSEDAMQARRLQAVLEFKERFISHTVVAQVVGTSGVEQSRVLYIDKGSRDGLQPDMPVITPEGIVGKVRDVFRSTSQVLLMNDSNSGVGAILQNSRLYGVVKGTPEGELRLDHVMSDEKVQAGEPVVTSGGDRIFPKGLPIGNVAKVQPGSDLFLNILVAPAAKLNQLEEVLVITEMQGAPLEAEGAGPIRAADILAQRLPGLTHKDDAAVTGPKGEAKNPGAPAEAKKPGAEKSQTGPQGAPATVKSVAPAKKTGPAPPTASPAAAPTAGQEATPPQ